MKILSLSFDTELEDIGDISIDFTYYRSKHHHDVRIDAITAYREAVSGETLWNRISIKDLPIESIERLEKLCLNHADGLD